MEKEILSLDDMVKYVLIIREEEMNNNYPLSESKVELIRRVKLQMSKDPSIKTKLDNMMISNSLTEMYAIAKGEEIPKINRQVNNVNQIKQEEKGKQYVLTNKKAGFADMLILALGTGLLIGSVTTSIILTLV